MAGPKTLADRYELISVLGEGGMGVVWRARDTRLSRAVAVKLLPPGAIGNDLARARLLREARAAGGLDHEGIVHVYDVGETPDGGAFLVMELIRGRSLRDALLAPEAMTLARRLSAIVAAARALGFAHGAGIVHRDVKPDNIMIRDDGRVAVVDFGVAKPVTTALVDSAETVPGVTEKSLTAAGQLVGTPAYLAPEQAKGQAITNATDQFALAVTAFEALAGRLPWTGGGVIEVVASMLRDAPPAISASGLPVSFDPIFARALAKDPKDRFPDMDSFADELEAAGGDLLADANARPSGRQAVVAAARTAALTKETSTATPPPVGSPPRSRVRLGIAAFAIVFIAGAAAFATRKDAAKASDTSTPIACPPFAVVGTDEHWLGAAAAALACERIQIARGGLDARTIVPAELFGVTGDLSRDVPLGLYEDRAGRERAIAATRERKASWIDGTIEMQPNGYLVRAVLRGSDDRALVQGEGRGIEIFEAVRDAVAPTIAAEHPSTQDLGALRTSLDVGSVDDALLLLDLRTAVLIEDPVSLKEQCEKVEKRTTLEARVSYLAKLMCVKRLRTGMVLGTPPAIDESTNGALITTMLAQGTTGGTAEVRARGERLERAIEKAGSPEAMARTAAAAAEVYNLVGDDRTRGLSRRSILLSSKAVDWRMSTWHRITFASDGDEIVGRSLGVWQPWEPVSQSLRVRQSALHDLKATNTFIRRTYYLGRRGYYADQYGHQLLVSGDIEAARGVAESTDDDLLRVGILIAEARYGAALNTVKRLLDSLPATEEKAALAFRLAHEGARTAQILGRPADFVDGVVSKYVFADPHHIVDGVIPFASLVAACCLAPSSIGKRCIDRIDQLRHDGQLPTIFQGAEPVMAGASRFVVGDYAGASRSWRTMLRSAGSIQNPLRDVMAIAFDRSDMPELGDEIDQPSLAAIDQPRPAELAWVRSANRAYKRGDHARARKIAQAVVDKWRFADEDLPGMREMKELLAKLPP